MLYKTFAFDQLLATKNYKNIRNNLGILHDALSYMQIV